ncbi:MAG: hypothetical protein QXT26_04040 [Thermoproteota archaeon]
MKVNYVGIIGGILAFISLILPWWTLTLSGISMGIPVSVDVLIYPYGGTVSFMGSTISVPMSTWFGSSALALIVIGGILGIIGSIIPAKRKTLIAGGVLALISIIIFAAGLQIQLSALGGASIPIPDGLSITMPAIGLFGSGAIEIMGVSLNYTCYLSFGFWIALIASILMLAATKKAEVIPPPPTPVTAPVPPPP